METKTNWINPIDKLKEQDKYIYRTGLKVFNSLTNQKEEFITKDGSKTVSWYMCGPTVYDSAHLGHARTYLCFDVIRRIMTTYFGYDVNLCMNITDIDDKIIKRSNEQKIEYTQFTRHWEDSFFNDMKKLNVMYPNTITRVTEYVPEVVDFIKTLIEKNYAYESKGSVYFNIEEYTKNNHAYAKLSRRKEVESLHEAEEDSTTNTKEKKNEWDFALWKKSKEDEPFWDSPWGNGRPGWHIECSVMCSAVFGESLDVHSGGVDLKFPHHDNEIAQTEGYYDNQQWINYFLHTGHLDIEGLKMSKSLKNFITISDLIEKFNPNTFRLYFISSRWDGGLEFTESALGAAAFMEKYIGEFFQNVKVWIRENDLKKVVKFDSTDLSLNKLLQEKKNLIHEALCDSFYTPLALQHLNDLISKTYEYESKTRNASFKIHLIYSVTQYVSHIVKSFGLVYKTEFIDYFILDSNDKSSEQTVSPYIDAAVKFRDNVKAAADEKDVAKVMQVCDDIRDEVFPFLGVKIEDRKKGQSSMWKFYDKDEYIKDLAREKELKEITKKKSEDDKKQNQLKLITPAKEYYAMLNDKYSLFDENGVPTHDAKGFELSKEIKNKLKKEFEKHEKKHQQWAEKNKK